VAAAQQRACPHATHCRHIKLLVRGGALDGVLRCERPARLQLARRDAHERKERDPDAADEERQAAAIAQATSRNLRGCDHLRKQAGVKPAPLWPHLSVTRWRCSNRAATLGRAPGRPTAGRGGRRHRAINPIAGKGWGVLRNCVQRRGMEVNLRLKTKRATARANGLGYRSLVEQPGRSWAERVFVWSTCTSVASLLRGGPRSTFAAAALEMKLVHGAVSIGIIAAVLFGLPAVIKPRWNDLLALFGDKEIVQFALSVTVAHLSMLVFANGFFGLCYAGIIPILRNYKIHPDRWPWESGDAEKRAAFWKLLRKAILLTLFNNIVIAIPAAFGNFDMAKKLGLSTQLADFPHPLTVFWQLLAFMLVEDVLFYTSHRTLHTFPFLYKHVHKASGCHLRGGGWRRALWRLRAPPGHWRNSNR